MVKRLSLLADATKVSLPSRNLVGPALRRNHPGHRMSTYEAVVQALAILEGEAITDPLFDFYRRAVDRMLFVRGHLKFGDVLPDPRGTGPGTSTATINGTEPAETQFAAITCERTGESITTIPG
jgi:hypothetical protein